MRIFSYLIGVSLSTALLKGGHSDGTQEEHRSHQQEGRVGRFQGSAEPAFQQSCQDRRRFGTGPEAQPSQAVGRHSRDRRTWRLPVNGLGPECLIPGFRLPAGPLHGIRPRLHLVQYVKHANGLTIENPPQ